MNAKKIEFENFLMKLDQEREDIYLPIEIYEESLEFLEAVYNHGIRRLMVSSIYFYQIRP